MKGAGHFSFVTTFPTVLKIVAGDAARDPDGFDRDAFHEVMNREIVGFFNRTLRPGGDPLTMGARPRPCRWRRVEGAGVVAERRVVAPSPCFGGPEFALLTPAAEADVVGRTSCPPVTMTSKRGQPPRFACG